MSTDRAKRHILIHGGGVITVEVDGVEVLRLERKDYKGHFRAFWKVAGRWFRHGDPADLETLQRRAWAS